MYAYACQLHFAIAWRGPRIFSCIGSYYWIFGIGFKLLEDLFSVNKNATSLRTIMEGSYARMHGQRQRDFGGSVLWHQNNRATEYFSRWIELKETKTLQTKVAAEQQS